MVIATRTKNVSTFARGTRSRGRRPSVPYVRRDDVDPPRRDVDAASVGRGASGAGVLMRSLRLHPLAPQGQGRRRSLLRSAAAHSGTGTEKRGAGVEPAFAAYGAAVLPLDYPRAPLPTSLRRSIETSHHSPPSTHAESAATSTTGRPNSRTDAAASTSKRKLTGSEAGMDAGRQQHSRSRQGSFVPTMRRERLPDVERTPQKGREGRGRGSSRTQSIDDPRPASGESNSHAKACRRKKVPDGVLA
jgi:hypothetical protein